MAFSPDGKTLTVGGRDEAVVRFLAADTLEEKSRLRAPSMAAANFVHEPTFSPDGRWFAAIWGTRRYLPHGFTFEIPHHILLWDLSKAQQMQQLPARHGSRLTFAPDGKTLACHDGCAIRLYDTSSGRSLHHRPGHDQIGLALAASPDGKIIASGDHDGVLRLWDATTSRQLRKWQERNLFITDCFLSSDGQRVAAGNLGAMEWSGGVHFTFHVWNVTNGKPLGRIIDGEGKGKIACLHTAALSADGKYFAGVYSKEEDPPGQLVVWDADSGKRLSQRPYQFKIRGEVDGLIGDGHADLAPGGERLSVWLGKRLGIEEVSTGCLLAKLPREVKSPLVFSSDGRLLAALIRSAKDGDPEHEGIEVRSLIEMATGEEVVRLNLPAPNTIAFSPDSRALIVSDHKNLCVWDTVTGEKLHQVAWPDSIAKTLDDLGWPYVPSLVALPGGRVAASMAEGDILLWDLEVSTWSGHKPKRELGPKGLASLWSDLAGDARKASRALHTLAATPEQAVPLLRTNLEPASNKKVQHIEKLLADLDDDSFRTREAASQELSRTCYEAEPLLRRALQGRPSLEMRRRLEALLAQPRRPSKEALRTLRAIAVLERIGTSEARCILEKLADGALTPETREAKAALRRWNPP